MRAGEAVTLVARTRRGPGLPPLPGQAREMSVKRRLTPKRERETPEYAAMVRRIIRAHGRRVIHADPEDLAELVALRAVVDQAITDAVQGMRAEHGRSWSDIGRGLGTSRQAAQMRYGAGRSLRFTRTTSVATCSAGRCSSTARATSLARCRSLTTWPPLYGWPAGADGCCLDRSTATYRPGGSGSWRRRPCRLRGRSTHCAIGSRPGPTKRPETS